MDMNINCDLWIVDSQVCLQMAFIIVLFIQILQTIVSRAEDGTRTQDLLVQRR